MFFEFDGICKKCGNTTHFSLTPEHPEEIRYFLQCHTCGRSASDQDAERILHLMDVLATADERNNATKISKIIVHRQ